MVKETKLELKEAPKGFNLMPDCSGAMDELEELVYKRAGERYGDILPDEVAKRISMELDMVPSDVFAKNLLVNAELVSSDLFSDKRFFVRGTADNSFINYLIGLSVLNPLSNEMGGYGLEPEFFFGIRRKRTTPAIEIACHPSKLSAIKGCILDTRRDKNLIGTLISDIFLQILSFVAENERTTIRQRQAEGIAAAKARGVRFGRAPKHLPENFHDVYQRWKRKELTIEQAATECGMAKSTFYDKATKYGKPTLSEK